MGRELMKSLAGHIVLTLLLVGVGDLLRRAANVEERLASAEAGLATLLPDTAEDEYARVEEELALAARVPFVGDALMAEVRRERALAAYWRGDYAALPSDEAELSQPGVGADVVFLAANAAFRTALTESEGKAAIQELDGVLRLYTTLMRQSPGHTDAAHNYEYVVRLRNVMAKAGAGDIRLGMARPEMPPPSLHGQQGSPPPETGGDQFNVIVPLRPDERGEVTKAGAGAPPQRKG